MLGQAFISDSALWGWAGFAADARVAGRKDQHPDASSALVGREKAEMWTLEVRLGVMAGRGGEP